MVEIIPYDPCWPVEFQGMAGELRSGLGPLALRIDHPGRRGRGRRPEEEAGAGSRRMTIDH
jgi:hypothetical protein